MSGCHPQEATLNCGSCHCTHFISQIRENNYMCRECNAPFPSALMRQHFPQEKVPMSIDMEHNEKTKHWLMNQVEEMNARLFDLAKQVEFLREQRRPEELEIMLEKIKSFYADYGHRLAIIEDLFAGKSFKPIHDAMELHVEAFNKRIELLEEWRKKIHNDIVCPSGDYMWKTQPSNYDAVLCKKFNDLQEIVEQRLKHLEDSHASDMDDDEYDERHEAQENAHGWLSKCSSQESNNAICDLNDRLVKLEMLVSDFIRSANGRLEKLQIYKHTRPHKCPVCHGAGNLKRAAQDHPNFNFYAEYASCQSCEGKGIVWG